ncbi:MAG: hypothetical protein M1609_14565 [Firmicutes bacterium]|nr:hypothetical protein [Bacillota bacterium]
MKKQKVDYHHLYLITGDVTPLEDDCGVLCGRVCCRPDRKNSLGVYLFPGEEVLFPGEEPWFAREYHDPREHGFPDNWKEPVHFLKCRGPCRREKRPLACRFFPLAPHLLMDGTFLITSETARLPYRCPLVYRKIPLREVFIETVSLTWRLLLEDERMLRLVEEDSREREKTLSTIPAIIWAGAHRL